MNINTNNYQELLLLYVDGELQPHEMDAVDEFVAKNYEAKEELDLLLSTKLDSIDHEEFKGLQKDALFKFENDEINLHNYPAYFVEYVNNALNDTDKKQVEDFAKSNQKIANEFELYLQTKALPDYAVVFENKEVLYKKVAKRPIVFMYFKQFSAAAVVIGILLTTFIVFNKEGKNDVAVTPPTIKTEKQLGVENNATVGTTQQQTVTSTAILNKEVSTKINTNKKQTITTNSTTSTKNNPTNDVAQIKKTNNTPNNTVVQNNTLQTTNEIVKNQSPTIKPADNEIKLENKTIQTSTTNTEVVTSPTNATEIKNTINTSTAKNVVYKTLDVDTENDNTVYVGNLKLNKQKVNGLLNKVGKIFGKSKKAQLEDVATSTASL
jgi:hypothetical protein